MWPASLVMSYMASPSEYTYMRTCAGNTIGAQLLHVTLQSQLRQKDVYHGCTECSYIYSSRNLIIYMVSNVCDVLVS